MQVHVEQARTDLVGLPDLVEQGLRHVKLSSAAPQSGGDNREQSRLASSVVLEMVGQIGVEGPAVAASKLVPPPVAEQDQLVVLVQGALAAARLVHRRVLRAAGDGAGRKRVEGELGSLAWDRRRQHLGTVYATRVPADSPLLTAPRRTR